MDRALPDAVRENLLARSARLRCGIRRALAGVAAVLVVVLGISWARTAGAAEETGNPPDLLAGLLFVGWQAGGGALLLEAASLLHALRSRSLAEDARPVFGIPGEGQGPLGTGLFPQTVGPPGVILGGSLAVTAARSVSGWLPSMGGPWFLPWEGKTRCVQVHSFGDEEPVLASDGRGLFLVSPGAWYYPPTPCLIRTTPHDPDAPRIREFVRDLEALDAAGSPLPPFVGDGDAPARTRRAARWAAAGLAAAGVLLMLPIFLSFGWAAVGLMALATGGMLAVGALARSHDWAGDVRKWREGGRKD